MIFIMMIPIVICEVYYVFAAWCWGQGGDDHGYRISDLHRRIGKVESVGHAPLYPPTPSPRQSLVPPPQGLHLSLKPSPKNTTIEPICINVDHGIPNLGEDVRELKGMGWERQVQVRQARLEEEVVLLRGLKRDVDAQVPPTNLEDEVGGQQGLERVVEEEVRSTNLDDEVVQVDDNRIREGQVGHHIVEEDDTPLGDAGEANVEKANLKVGEGV